MFRFTIRELLLVTVIVALGLVVARDHLATRPTRLGIEGYCPVTIVHSSRWQIGDTKFQAVFEGRRYLFADETKQQIFLGNPGRYAPVCSGNDIVRLTDEQRESEGSTSYGVASHGRIYLFDSPETRDKFETSARTYTAAALALRTKSK